MAFQGNGFVFGEVVESYFMVGAGQQDVFVELVHVYQVSVLVRVEIGFLLIGSLGW